MKSTKSIERIIPPPPLHMVGDGFRVHNFFPSSQYIGEKRMSPFFMMDYASKFTFPPSNTPRGVGVHPHKGFETVTIAYQGKVAHHDSAGNAGIIGEGDVQWMTAASGILHKEYHDKDWSKVGGDFQMVQLWVNLPAKHKLSKPKYQALERASFGKYNLRNDKGVVEVIAGNYKDAEGSAFTFTPIEMYNARLKEGAELTFSFPANYNTGILVLEGSASINEQLAAVNKFVLFANDGEEITITTTEETVLLILSGEPIDEPLVHYGPFLMNTKEEIMEAYNDFNNGKFGYLAD